MNKRFRFIARPAVALGSLAVAAVAKADSTAATTAITGAQTDALAVVGALLSLGIAVWGANYLRKKFFR